jgi:hypothetical protein
VEKHLIYGQSFASDDRFSAHLDLPKTPKSGNTGNSRLFRIGSGLAIPLVIKTSCGIRRRIGLIPKSTWQNQLQRHAHFSGEGGGSMYLLFGPSMAALVVIAVIQLRDHFVASR